MDVAAKKLQVLPQNTRMPHAHVQFSRTEHLSHLLSLSAPVLVLNNGQRSVFVKVEIP